MLPIATRPFSQHQTPLHTTLARQPGQPTDKDVARKSRNFCWQHRSQIMQAQSRAGLFVAGKPRLLQSATRYLHADVPASMARCGTA